MSDINLQYKINLRNKYLNKIIKNFKEVNSSLELLNNFNQKMNRQYGGVKSAQQLAAEEAAARAAEEAATVGDVGLEHITGFASTLNNDIKREVSTSETQIGKLDETTQKVLSALIMLATKLGELQINTKNPTITTNQEEVRQQILDLIAQIK